MSLDDPHVWSGRALQEVFVELAVAVLHQCIRPLIGANALLAIMDISARAISLADRPHRAIRVTSVRTRREDRSSISSHPLADLGGKVCWVYLIAVFSSLSRRFFSMRLHRCARHLLMLRPIERRYLRFFVLQNSSHQRVPPRRCGRACWRAQWRARCGAIASWRFRSIA